jgi:hypothetical protein
LASEKYLTVRLLFARALIERRVHPDCADGDGYSDVFAMAAISTRRRAPPYAFSV